MFVNILSASFDNLKSRIFLKFYSFSHFVIKQEVVVESIFELVDCLLRETDPGQNTHASTLPFSNFYPGSV